MLEGKKVIWAAESHPGQAIKANLESRRSLRRSRRARKTRGCVPATPLDS
ncbi:MAG: RRXRR domain-containing protein [Microcoleus sp.]